MTGSLHAFRGQLLAAILLGPAIAGCDSSAPPADSPEVGGGCLPDGMLTVSIYGGLEGELDWRGSDLGCEGMQRPHEEGARLRFEGPAPGAESSQRLAFIIALPELERGQVATELPAGVTLMEVDAGRFFSTPEQASCWVDLDRHEASGPDADEYRISGLLYCVAPLAEVNGAASVSLRDLRFAGRLDWSEPE